MGKIFVQITVEHDLDGKIKPLSLKWEDGRVFIMTEFLMSEKLHPSKVAAWKCGTPAGYVAKKFICLMMREDGLWRNTNYICHMFVTFLRYY